MTDTFTIPPMPDTHCPSWCTEDHTERWERHATICLTSWSIPNSDGTLGHHEPDTIEDTIERWSQEVAHFRTLGTVALLEGDQQARIDVQSDPSDDNTPTLYLIAEGALTPEQARQVAALLLNAADTFEGLTSA